MVRADTGTLILDAAAAAYGRAGARGFSMRSVAAEAGITATAIYRHYPEKAALAGALVDRARRLLGGYLLEGMRGKDALERLWSCADSYVGFFHDHPQLYRLLFLDPIEPGLPEVDELQEADEAAPFRFVIDRAREAMDDGFLTPGDPGQAALAVWAHLHGLCALSLAGRIPIERMRSITRASLDHLYEGLKRRDSDA